MIKVPLDFVNAIVALSYKVKSGAILAKYDRLFNEGIITEEMLHGKSLQLSDHFIPGISELQDSINLFFHIYAIVMNSHGARNSNLELLHTPCSRPEHKKRIATLWLTDRCTTIFEAVKEKVFKLMRFEDLQVEPAFLCPCDPSHVVTICGDPDIVCSETDTSQVRLKKQHLFWFQDQVQNLDQKPELKDLVEELGLEGKLDNIKSDHPEKSQHCLSEMLSTWLKVEPRATWHTLCAALRSRTVGEQKLAGNLVAKYHKHSCI